MRPGVANGGDGDAGLQLAQAACGTTTNVPREVVTGIRVPPGVMTVKPALLASDIVPWTATQPGGGVTLGVPFAPGSRPTVSVAAATVPPERGPSTMTGFPSVMSLSSGPAALTRVDAVVVTVTG